MMDLVAGRADVRFVRATLRHGARPGAVNIDGEPLIYVAARGGHWDSVRALIGAGADVNANDGIEWQTVLSVASGFGNFEQAYWLLEHGANPTYALKQAPTPDRIGARPILEDIYWRPPGDEQPADSLEWQTKCQQWLRAHGIAAPPEPERWRRLRSRR